MDSQCSRCGAKCCTYFCFQLDTPESYEEFENIRWFLCHQGVTVHIDQGDWYIAIANRCLKLDDDGRCTIYEDRPVICRSYSTDGCDFTGGDYDYDQLFTSPEQIDDYARQTLGKAYDKEKAKARGEKPKKKKKKKKKDKDKKAKADGKSKTKPKGKGKGKAKGNSKGSPASKRKG
jgi:Fe-S-cluster containining protein